MRKFKSTKLTLLTKNHILMKKGLFFIAFLLTSLFVQAQYSVGTTSITFTDPARGNRSVPTEIYYPATSAGTNTTVATGQFPLVVFGHGFLIGYTQYTWLANALVDCGYIVAFPDTETGFPDHANFGGDLAFLVPAIQAEGANAGSILFGAVGTTSAIGGHSMGGGASFLGAENNTVITALFNFAAAETNTSAIAAAANVLVPTLVIEGSEDCVVPSSGNTGDMYAALNVACKALVNIVGASHCQFSNNDFVCTLGEFGCGATISQTAQETMVLDYLKPWLDHHLKGDCDALTTFDNSIMAGVGLGTNTDFQCTVPVCMTMDTVYLAPKVLLEGSYLAGGTMRTDLNTEGLLPLTQPYNAAPYSYAGTETLAAIPATMVDWVLVEVRSGSVATSGPRTSTTEQRRAAILLNNGNIVDIDGVSPVCFDSLSVGQNYNICVRHRNHLDVVSANTFAASSGASIAYDFTGAVSQSIGLTQQKLSADGFATMFAGEYNQDGVIQNVDKDNWRASPAILYIYSILDGNMDGVIQTTDYDTWYPNRAVNGISEIDY